MTGLSVWTCVDAFINAGERRTECFRENEMVRYDRACRQEEYFRGKLVEKLAALEAFRDNFADIIRRNCQECEDGLVFWEAGEEHGEFDCPYCTALIEAIEADQNP